MTRNDIEQKENQEIHYNPKMDEIQIDENAFINSYNKFGVQSANNLGLSFTEETLSSD